MKKLILAGCALVLLLTPMGRAGADPCYGCKMAVDVLKK